METRVSLDGRHEATVQAISLALADRTYDYWSTRISTLAPVIKQQIGKERMEQIGYPHTGIEIKELINQAAELFPTYGMRLVVCEMKRGGRIAVERIYAAAEQPDWEALDTAATATEPPQIRPLGVQSQDGGSQDTAEEHEVPADDTPQEHFIPYVELAYYDNGWAVLYAPKSGNVHVPEFGSIIARIRQAIRYSSFRPIRWERRSMWAFDIQHSHSGGWTTPDEFTAAVREAYSHFGYDVEIVSTLLDEAFTWEAELVA